MPRQTVRPLNGSSAQPGEKIEYAFGNVNADCIPTLLFAHVLLVAYHLPSDGEMQALPSASQGIQVASLKKKQMEVDQSPSTLVARAGLERVLSFAVGNAAEQEKLPTKAKILPLPCVSIDLNDSLQAVLITRY